MYACRFFNCQHIHAHDTKGSKAKGGYLGTLEHASFVNSNLLIPGLDLVLQIGNLALSFRQLELLALCMLKKVLGPVLVGNIIGKMRSCLMYLYQLISLRGPAVTLALQDC